MPGATHDDATQRGASISGERRVLDLSREPLVALVSGANGVTILPVPEKAPFIIGRAEECELHVVDPTVSRRHLRVIVDSELGVEDLGSANGSSYEGRALTPHTVVPVELGAPVTLGSVTIFFHPAQSVVAPGRAAGPGVLYTPPDVEIVRDPALARIYAMLQTVGPSPLSVLILGETGVGKEVFADAIHRSSRRSGEPFVKINCAALPESILEGELFGYEKGAFSGAVVARPGLFESAHKGTLFLDEVGELPLHIQAKLLRVLESGEVLRLGARTPSKIDVRFIAATNQDLRGAVSRGEFRADLFYRLDGVSVTIPPLRERAADILALAEFFLARLAGRMGLVAPTLADDAREMLCDYPWPGNVRELRNVVERALVMNPEVAALTSAHLLLNAPTSTEPPPTRQTRLSTVHIDPEARTSLRESLGEAEKAAIVSALEKTGGNQSAAARMLGIGRHALITRMDTFGIARPKKSG
jgi:two-component system, NtrC family, response regulator AtoC